MIGAGHDAIRRPYSAYLRRSVSDARPARISARRAALRYVMYVMGRMAQQHRVWDKFEPVIGRATDAIRGNGIDPSHHIAQTSNMMEVGKGGALQRRPDGWYWRDGTQS